jgi:hypothetical protein
MENAFLVTFLVSIFSKIKIVNLQGKNVKRNKLIYILSYYKSYTVCINVNFILKIMMSDLHLTNQFTLLTRKSLFKVFFW